MTARIFVQLCGGARGHRPGLAQNGDEILEKVDRNLMPESFESYRKLINIEPDGSQREFILFTVKKGNDKVVSLFLSPASEEGRATLRLGDNMWLYIPNVGKPIRITSLQSVVGGVFNNADIYASRLPSGVRRRGRWRTWARLSFDAQGKDRKPSLTIASR